MTVARADASELAVLAGPAPSTGFRNDLASCNLVAIRGLETGTENDALGWRVTLANEWITSPLVRVVPGPTAVETTSGHTYRLTTPDRARMEPIQGAHLEYALRGLDGLDGMDEAVACIASMWGRVFNPGRSARAAPRPCPRQDDDI